MPTIAELALTGQGFDVVETALVGFHSVPCLHSPHAGRVDDRATLWPDE